MQGSEGKAFPAETAPHMQVSLFQGVVKDLGPLTPGCRDEQNYSRYYSPDYHLSVLLSLEPWLFPINEFIQSL